MNLGNVTAEAKALPAGAVFHRCALQVNPYSYKEFRGQKIEKDEPSRARAARDHAEAIVARAMELEISVLAITNHNDVSGITDFKQAGKNSGITIFPGFELASKDGAHVLCIYPEETDEERLKLYLGEFGIRTPGPSKEVSERYFAEILESVHSQGGVAIAAHATNSKGVLRAFSGTTRINAWKNEYLQAVQIPGSAQDLPQDLRGIVTGKNPDYRRAPAVALLNAGDIDNAADLEQPSATCWIKMSEPSVEGLRQAFLDPESRIRLRSDPTPPPHSELLAISWEGGFLDGVTFRFNPNLNILIGGRGAGKSTIIESLRHVLDLEPLGEEARNAHKGIVREVLKSGTKITLRACSHHPAEQVYVIERTVPNPPIVRDDSGEISNLSPREIFRGLEIYGQHEIAELTKSRGKLTSLLHRFVAPDTELERKKKTLQRKLQQTRQSLLSVQDDLQQVDERLATLPALEETLARFPKEAGLESKLLLPKLLTREESLLNSVPGHWEAFAKHLSEIRRELPIDRTFVSERALRDLPNREILAQANNILEKMDRDMKAVATQLETAINLAEKNFASVRATWQKRREDAQSDYQKILRELQKSSVDGEEFLRLQREVENLRPMRELQAKLRQEEAECQQQRQASLAEWEDIKARQFRSLDQASRKVSRKLDAVVKVQVTAAGNRTPLGDLLRERIGGRLSEALEILAQVPELSLPEFVAACRNGAEALQEKYAIPSSQATRLAGSPEETLLLAEELDLPPTTEIQLNLAPAGADPTWRALEELSTGQKATAVLLLLLLESDAPLIVDQPEDDLDNRFIMGAVVPRIREGKWTRQFAFSTHNANIPVLGDAEMVLGLSDTETAGETRARVTPEHMGAIDVSSVRELIEEVLEGGREAFENRRRKYGF